MRIEAKRRGVGLAGRVGGRNRGMKNSVFIWCPFELQSQVVVLKEYCFRGWGFWGGEREGKCGADGGQMGGRRQKRGSGAVGPARGPNQHTLWEC
jgi:hypothetical protein